MKNIKKVEYWLDSAEYDFKSAKVMLKGKRYLYVGFLCHQTIEKALKACYSSRNDDNPPYIHKLITLGRKAGIYDEMDDTFKAIIDLLEPLNIEERYPSQKDELIKSLSKTKCRNIIKQTEELHN